MSINKSTNILTSSSCDNIDGDDGGGRNGDDDIFSLLFYFCYYFSVPFFDKLRQFISKRDPLFYFLIFCSGRPVFLAN